MKSKKHYYIESFKTIRLSAYRFGESPYAHKYTTDETVHGMYCNRFYPLKTDAQEDPLPQYWKLRKEVLLYDVPEKPLAIRGRDAVKLLEKVLVCRVETLKIGRARYGIACREDGTILMDGVLMRLAEDHFWYVKANGEFMSWLQAHGTGMDVTVSDPDSRVIQIQGPNALKVLNAAMDGALPDSFKYFHAGIFSIGGQELLVSRTGWTGEVGIEIYSNSGYQPTDHDALWDHLFVSGEPFGMAFSSASSMGIRRIEAGILDNGSDIEPDLTPYGAGLAKFVNFKKGDFIGRTALESASKTQLLFGLTCPTATPATPMQVYVGEKAVGHITIGTWSPTLETGIGYVRFYEAQEDGGDWLGRTVMLQDADDNPHESVVVSLPFYDAEKLIPRGLA